MVLRANNGSILFIPQSLLGTPEVQKLIEENVLKHEYESCSK